MSQALIRTRAWTGGLLGAAVLLAGCGGHGAASAATVIGTRTLPGMGAVLVDGSGHTLYSPVQEASGRILCTGTCPTAWPPLTVPAGWTPPSGVPGLSGTLGTVTRPGGALQVTFDGQPLYRFVQDTQAGTALGAGAQDEFAGVAFTWHLVPANGSTPPAMPAPSSAGTSSAGTPSAASPSGAATSPAGSASGSYRGY